MFKKLGLFGLISLAFVAGFPVSAKPKNVSQSDQKIVAWDIHGVLCSQPGKHGWNCKPNPETFKLVKELHEKGIKQVIFSNISRQSFIKLKLLYPALFHYFDMTQSMANAQGIFTRKPHSKYIKKFLKKVDAAPNNIIFFDDKPKNISAARGCCIDAYHFSNPAQGRAILKQRNLL